MLSDLVFRPKAKKALNFFATTAKKIKFGYFDRDSLICTGKNLFNSKTSFERNLALEPSLQISNLVKKTFMPANQFPISSIGPWSRFRKFKISNHRLQSSDRLELAQELCPEAHKFSRVQIVRKDLKGQKLSYFYRISTAKMYFKRVCFGIGNARLGKMDRITERILLEKS
jgi:hypothetical protein